MQSMAPHEIRSYLIDLFDSEGISLLCEACPHTCKDHQPVRTLVGMVKWCPFLVKQKPTLAAYLAHIHSFINRGSYDIHTYEEYLLVQTCLNTS